MILEALWDPLFRVPLAAGLLAATVLAALGTLLHLRDEWLAALGLAHLAAAAGLAGLAAGLPVMTGALVGALAGALLKYLAGGRSGHAYGLMILAGWTTTFLVAANTPLGSALGHALVEGQLYFAGRAHLLAAVLVAMLTALAYPWLARRLLRARLFTQHEGANRLPAWRWHLGFDGLVALAIGVGTATIGLMASFALVFLPGWIAFRRASGWDAALVLSVTLGGGAYGLAFALALGWDQPFGPVLVAVLLFITLLAWLTDLPVPARAGNDRGHANAPPARSLERAMGRDRHRGPGPGAGSVPAPETPRPGGSAAPMISVRDLRHVYAGQTVLEIPVWEAARGDHWLILGPSGSGKTSLLHILAGILQPTRGRVLVNGTELAGLRPGELDRFRGRQVGIVFQGLHLVNALPAAENLLLAQYLAGLPPDRREVQRVLDNLGLGRRHAAYPHELSHGQRQRLAIARAVLNRPALLLADEPTASLDDSHCEQVLTLLKDQAELCNASLIIATHDQRVKSRFEHRLELEGRP